ncbi:hypothetical protein GCM10010521_52510 [Streptomyces rameus]|uniref:Uncharacterized protein n=1 Tax=Streptomyces rameus TaxID=68261 RepID=A0ABP6NTU5_9ACTN
MRAGQTDPDRPGISVGVVPQHDGYGPRVLLVRDDMSARVLFDYRHRTALSRRVTYAKAVHPLSIKRRTLSGTRPGGRETLR